MPKSRKKQRRPSTPKPLIEPPKLLEIDPAPVWRWWATALMVAVIAAVVYLPTLNNDFINWDDFDYLTKNLNVSEPAGLGRIWDPREDHPQFYPMVFSSFWLEHKVVLWMRGTPVQESYAGVDHLQRGFEPWIFHLTNLVLHAVVTALVVWLLRLLGVRLWVAWLTAALFAVHPINVASVAWVAERKNVLSGVFYLLSLILYVKNTRRPHALKYGGSLLLFIAALLSKSAMITLPATAMLCDRLIERRWRWRSFARVAPMLALGLGSAILTAYIERGNAGTTMVPLEVYLRPFAAAGAIWFYIGKLLVPYHFPGVYTRWDLTGNWPVFLGALVAVPLAVMALWNLRRKIPDHALWGLAHYVVSLSPMLGLIAFNYTQFSFVADHFVYLSCVGILLCVALAADALRRRMGDAPIQRAPVTAAALAIIVLLGALSFHHAKTVWTDGQTFWEYTLRLNSGCWPGHYNLGNIYRRSAAALATEEAEARSEGRLEEAERLNTEQQELLADAAECYRKAAGSYKAAIDEGGLGSGSGGGLYQAHGARASALRLIGRVDEAIEEYGKALKIRPRHAGYRFRRASALTQVGRIKEAEEEYRTIIRTTQPRNAALRNYILQSHIRLAALLVRQRRYDEAADVYRGALRINPNYAPARRGLESVRRVQSMMPDQSRDEP